jgi:hypothetical protein
VGLRFLFRNTGMLSILEQPSMEFGAEAPDTLPLRLGRVTAAKQGAGVWTGATAADAIGGYTPHHCTPSASV